MSETTYYQRNRAKDYFENNKELLRGQKTNTEN